MSLSNISKKQIIKKYFTIPKKRCFKTYLYCNVNDDYRIDSNGKIYKNIRYRGHNEFFVEDNWYNFNKMLKKLDEEIERNKIENNNWNFKNL